VPGTKVVECNGRSCKVEVDNNQEQILMDTFEKIEKKHHKLVKKKEHKFWEEVALPINLSKALDQLTKYELEETARNLDIEKVRGLKKGELVLKLQQLIPIKSKEFFTFFDKEKYDIARKICSNMGYDLDKQNNVKKAEYFRYHGVIFTGSRLGKKVFFMPIEILKVFREVDNQDYIDIVNRNQEWIDITHGLLYYYGVLNLSQLVKLVEKYTGNKPMIEDYLKVINHSSRYYGEIEGTSLGYCSTGVLDDEELTDQQRAMQYIDYYPFTKAQLLKAGKPGYIDKTPELKSLLAYLVDKYNVTKEESDEIAKECIKIIAGGEGIHGVMEYLHAQFESPSLGEDQSLTEKALKLYNSTPMWALKGYSTKELRKKEKTYSIPRKQSNVSEQMIISR
jgi:hypothetical protein